MSTLYQAYRPQRFSDVYGQSHIITPLTQAIEKNRLVHAYLFHGPRGTGKTTTARLLAKRLTCLKSKNAEPCGTCASCKAAAIGRHFDITEIDAASNRGIDDIRALQEGINLKPTMGAYKVYIIDEVHMLTREAFTALLKTLEEPVAHAVFILATTELHKVPETILSRSQVYRFRRATHEELTERLQFIIKKEKRVVEPAALNFIINRSDGCYRDGESLLGQAFVATADTVTLHAITELLGLPSQELTEKFLLSLVKGESAGAVQVTDEVLAAGYDPEQFLQESIRAAREGAITLAKGEPSEALYTKESAAAERLPTIMRTLLQALQDLAYVPEPLIAIHLAILTLCTKPGVVKKAVAPQPIVAVQPAPKVAPIPPATPAPALQEVREAWPKLIQEIRKNNPVAATFLRAMEPASIEGDTLRVQTFYSLHRNFFEKEENVKPLEAALSQLTHKNFKIRCFLDEEGKLNSSQNTPKAESELLSAVKEVFG